MPTNSSFSFGLPHVVATTNTIFGAYAPDITANIVSDNYKIIAYDKLSINIEYLYRNVAMGQLALAEGSPYVSYSAFKAQTITFPSLHFNLVTEGIYSVVVNNQTYGLVVSGGSVVSHDLSSETIALPSKGSMTLFALANSLSINEMSKYALNNIQSVGVNYQIMQHNVVTEFTYNTTRQLPTLFAALPTQHISTDNNTSATAGEYKTIYGPLKLYLGTKFNFSTTKVLPTNQLDISAISQSERKILISALRIDTANTNLDQTDIYYGGKALYRAANLYSLAIQLNQPTIANAINKKIEIYFSQWFDPAGYMVRSNRYFYYDKTVKGLVGVVPAYGSDQFNDHDFDYGYFIDAASIMAKYNTNFVTKYEPFVNLLVSDIASLKQSNYFPQYRNFDPYWGHSWASGYGQFNDGNNQESSSEAINAWSGVGSWAAIINNVPLEDQSTWMLSNEIASSEAYWTDIPYSQTLYDGYQHKIIGINWGGKRDFATFFSSNPAAVLGIQLIPMNPAMQVLKSEGNRIPVNISGVTINSNYNVQFGDYMLMYLSLINKNEALSKAYNFNQSYLDNANSKSYLLAWIMSQK